MKLCLIWILWLLFDYYLSIHYFTYQEIQHYQNFVYYLTTVWHWVDQHKRVPAPWSLCVQEHRHMCSSTPAHMLLHSVSRSIRLNSWLQWQEGEIVSLELKACKLICSSALVPGCDETRSPSIFSAFNNKTKCPLVKIFNATEINLYFWTQLSFGQSRFVSTLWKPQLNRPGLGQHSMPPAIWPGSLFCHQSSPESGLGNGRSFCWSFRANLGLF